MKWFQSTLIMLLVFLSTGLIYAEVLIKPDDANINYYGRFDFSNSSTMVIKLARQYH